MGAVVVVVVVVDDGSEVSGRGLDDDMAGDIVGWKYVGMMGVVAGMDLKWERWRAFVYRCPRCPV
jgi:hypothetical protein